MLKKIPFDKIKATKNTLFFLSRAPTHHSFTFNLWFLYELKHKFHLPKTVCGIFRFRFGFVFIKVYVFFFNKMHGLFDFKTLWFFDLWFLSCNKNFYNSVISSWVGAPQNWLGDKPFKPRKSKFWDRQFFSAIVSFK